MPARAPERRAVVNGETEGEGFGEEIDMMPCKNQCTSNRRPKPTVVWNRKFHGCR